ncbi:hypothetical protein OIU77_021624 [Salix suchowensis]|uniref:Uncharacterized protein n=1 Tax=Salix suchowensis TaxID=1278906 RepID=A0ABQ9CBF9_9ROSI|nr:hypothetical protein OIU77_021624 [Salix suchowensis]
MDGLQLVSMPPRNAFRANQPKARGGLQPDPPYSINSCTRDFLETGAWHQSQNMVANKETRSNVFSDYPSCQSSVTCPDFYASTPKGCNVVSSHEANNSNVDKSANKKSRQKNRRGKQNKRVSSDTGSTEPEILSECAHESSTSESCSYNDHGDELISFATSSEVSFSDGSSNQIGFEGDTRFSSSEAQVICASNIEVAIIETFEALDVSSADGSSIQIDFEGDPRFSNSEASTICSSNSDEIDTVEDIIPCIAHSFPREHRMINSEIIIQPKGKGSSQIRGCDDMQSKDFSYAPDSSIVFDYVSIGSNSDDGPNDSHCAKPFHEASSRDSILEAPGCNSRKGSLSHKKSFNGAVDTYQHTEGSKHGSQNFSSSDAQLLKSGKKGKQIKASPRSASAHKYGGFGNLHVRAGKENNLSVWQKVQRNDVDTETKISPVCFQSDMSLKETPSLKRNSIVAEVNTLSRTVDKKLPKDKVSKKLKRKNSLGSKLDNSYHGRGHSSNKVSFNTLAKTGMRQNETFGLTAQVDDQKGGKSISKTHSVNSCLMVGFHPSRVECVNSESVNCSQVFPDAIHPPQISCDTVSSPRHHTENQDNSPAKLSNLLDQNVLKVPSPVYLPHLFFNKGRQMEKGIALAEYSKQNHSSGSVMQKWIPIGVRDSELATSARLGNSLPDPSDRPASEDFTLRNAQENASFNSQDLDSSFMFGTCQDSGNASSPQEDDHSQKLKNSTGWMLELNKKHIETVISTSESSDQRFSSFEDKSIKIIQAVKDACRVQMECEAIQMSTGSPVAEFERFLYFSSPVISQLPSLSCCQTCLCDRLVGAQLCRHEIPCIPLGCLWKWYEEHGNYGLEVRAEDFKNSKSWGLDCISFRGYFVPFLSAVQLIQELVRGNASSGCKMYGNPTNLASLNLQDLHPRSWYSVAWYPIYRIPEGNFRTAFLTYHSLGHLVHRSAKFDPPSKDVCVVSPVVGLQSYNAQGECWFQPRHSVNQTEGTPSLNPSVIMKERLRTLAETASLMARAVVTKGNQTSVNRHPDYEFFLSRRGYSLL